MLFLAATTLEKIKAVPPMFWVKAGAVIAAFIIGYIILQKLAGVNKLIMGVVIFVSGSITMIIWTYERNEPAFMTSTIDAIVSTGFFPTKDGTNLPSLDETGQKTRKAAPAPKPAPAKPASQPAKSGSDPAKK